MVTISMVVPTVLDLYTHLNAMKLSARFCRSIVNAMLQSMRKRFSGIFANCGMSGVLPPQQRTLGEKLPFSESVYLIALRLILVFFALG